MNCSANKNLQRQGFFWPIALLLGTFLGILILISGQTPVVKAAGPDPFQRVFSFELTEASGQGLSFVSLSRFPTTVTVNVYNPNGTLNRTRTVSLGAYETKTVFPGQAAGSGGWDLPVTSNGSPTTDTAYGMVATAAESFGIMLYPDQMLSGFGTGKTAIWAPGITQSATWGHYNFPAEACNTNAREYFFVTNPGTATANLSFSVYDKNGTAIGSNPRNFTLGAKQTRTFFLEADLATAPGSNCSTPGANQNIGITMTSSLPVSVSAYTSLGTDWSTGSSFWQKHDESAGVYPAYDNTCLRENYAWSDNKNGSQQTAARVTNPNNYPITISQKWYTTDGSPTFYERSTTIPAFGTAELPAPTNYDSGWKNEAVNGKFRLFRVLSSIDDPNNPNDQIGSYHVHVTYDQQIDWPAVFNTDWFWGSRAPSGTDELFLINPYDTPLTINVEYADNGNTFGPGQAGGTPIVIPARTAVEWQIPSDSLTPMTAPSLPGAANQDVTLHYFSDTAFPLHLELTYPGPYGDLQTYDCGEGVGFEYGDAPDTGLGTGTGNYNTTEQDNGPSHTATPLLYLGAEVDVEGNGQPTVGADGDDPNGTPDDEDGVVVTDLVLTNGTTANVGVTVFNNTGQTAYLVGWIDFDGDGIFEAGERVTQSIPSSASPQSVSLNFGTVNGVPGTTYARFRIGLEQTKAELSTGWAGAGEVEDYPVTILNPPAAIGNYVWLDENSDGYQDAGEPGLANVQVNLYDATGAPVATTYTDAQGGYLFDNLEPGTYYVDVLDGTGGQGYSLPYPGLTQTPYNLAGSDFGNQNHTGTPIPNTGFSGYQVVLGGGGENLTADFGYNANPTDCVNNPADPNCNDDTATLGDRVWIDADGDGFQDSNEAGLAGVTVQLFTAGPDGIFGTGDDVAGPTDTTDANGNYLFDGLAPGAYVVKVITPPAGYTQTGDPDHFGTSGGVNDNQTTTPVILGPGDVFLNADFGYQPPAAQNNSIGDKVWFDADADGVGPNGNGAAPGTDNTEYGIPGVTVALIKDTNGNGVWNSGEPIIATATTDANGDYLFPGLPDGNYLVWVNDTDNVLGDKTPTYDQNGGVIYAGSGAPTGVAASTVLGLSAAALDPGSTNAGPVSDLTQDFGYTAPGQAPTTGLIGDRVWFDIDSDGVQDANEPGLEGLTVTLKDNNGNTIATTTTDENGNYYFGGLPAGTYTVVVTPPAGLTQTYDADDTTGPFTTPHQSTVTIGGANPLINLDQDFGYVGTGTIGNLVWEDLNADGDVDTGENGIGGVTLDLYWDLNGNGKVDPGEPLVGSTTTANDGSYLFSGLPTDDGGGNAQFIVDVTDENGVLTGYWHSLGQAGQNDNSQVDPYPVTLTTGEPNNLTADFGYYVKPAALGNRVWSDTDGKPATDPSGVWDGLQESNELGIANVEVTLTIEYPDGTITVLKTKTDSNGFYSFGNLLLDEDYNAGTTGSPAGTGLPKYTLSISTAEQSRLLTDENLEPTGVKNEESGVGTPTEVRDDSNYHNGTIGMPVQGVTDTQAINPVTNEAVIASYDFGFKGSDTTPVTLGYFRATSVAGGIRFDWTTVTETSNAGFNLYVETAAGRQPVNSEMILDQPGDSMQARDYSYEAAGASGTVFYLEDVSVFAETRLHGPFNLNEVYGERVAPELIDWAAIAAEHAALDRRRATAEQAAAARMTAGQNATGSAIETNIGKPNKYPPIEFQVREDGIYRVTYEQIRAATGVKLYRVPAKQLALTNRGQPVPIYVSSWLFGPGEFIEFIGTGLDTFYTDTNVYRLEVNGDLNKKISVLRERPSIKGQIPSYYMETIEIERNLNYSSIAPNGDPWFDTEMFNRTAGVKEYPFDIPIDHYVPGVAPAYLTVSMWGLTGFVKNGPDHLIDVNLNGERVARAVFDINETVDLNVELANDALQAANNLVLVQSNPAWGLSPGNWSESYVDKYGLVYPRAFVAREDRLSFTSQGDAFRITNLSRPWIVAYGQVGDTVTRLQGRLLEYEGGGYAVTFNGLPGEARYYVSTVAGLRKPAISLARVAQPITQTPADILVIAHPNFIPGLKPWLDARSAGYKIRVVDVRDAYALYSGGIFDAQAIADYLRDAVPATGAKYVVLVGGDTIDYRNYLGANSMSFIPSLYAKASVYTDFAPVDPLFADINGDRVPDVAIGRFPVQTPAQLQLLINKTLLYDTATNVGTAVFAADSGFEADSDRFAAALPAGWSVSKAYVGPAGANATTARTTLLAAMNGGARLASFVGHSGSERWTFKNFFFAADAAALQNESLPMVVTQWGCYNTYYVEPKANTLGHNFLLSGMNGAAAVTGATTETSSRSEYKMGSLFMPRLMQPGMTLGTAMQQAKTELAVTDPFRTDVILGWTILGDPTLVVNPQP